MKKQTTNSSAYTKNNETADEKYFRDLRFRYGVELSGLQQGLYHIFYGDKQTQIHRNLKLTYNPHYGIYTALSLLLLIVVLIIMATYYKIKRKFQYLVRIYLLKRSKSASSRFTLSRQFSGNQRSESLQFIVTPKATKPEKPKPPLKSIESSLESVQKPKNGSNNSSYVSTMLIKTSSLKRAQLCTTETAHSMHCLWNTLTSTQDSHRQDLDSMSIRTAFESSSNTKNY